MAQRDQFALAIPALEILFPSTASTDNNYKIIQNVIVIWMCINLSAYVSLTFNAETYFIINNIFLKIVEGKWVMAFWAKVVISTSAIYAKMKSLSDDYSMLHANYHLQ